MTYEALKAARCPCCHRRGRRTPLASSLPFPPPFENHSASWSMPERTLTNGIDYQSRRTTARPVRRERAEAPPGVDVFPLIVPPRQPDQGSLICKGSSGPSTDS